MSVESLDVTSAIQSKFTQPDDAQAEGSAEFGFVR